MNKNAVPIISESDHILFDYLNVCKFLDLDFIGKHIYKNKSARYTAARINQLENFDYIKSIMLFDLKNNNASKGRKIVIPAEGSEDFLEFNLVNVNNTPTKAFSHIIGHQLYLAKILLLYLNQDTVVDGSVIKFVRMISDNEISLSGRYNNFRPDAGFILNINGNNVIYFIEAERSRAKAPDVVRKIFKQYGNITNVVSKLKIFENENIVQTRILFISSSKSQQDHLMKTVVQLGYDLSKVPLFFSNLSQLENDAINFGILESQYLTLNINNDTGEFERKKIFKK